MRIPENMIPNSEWSGQMTRVQNCQKWEAKDYTLHNHRELVRREMSRGKVARGKVVRGESVRVETARRDAVRKKKHTKER